MLGGVGLRRLFLPWIYRCRLTICGFAFIGLGGWVLGKGGGVHVGHGRSFGLEHRPLGRDGPIGPREDKSCDAARPMLHSKGLRALREKHLVMMNHWYNRFGRQWGGWVVAGLSLVCVVLPALAQEPTAIREAVRLLREEPRNPVRLQQLRQAVAAHLDDVDAPMGLAICALGSLALDQPAEAETALKALRARFADAPATHALSEWDGLFRPCGWCGGTGSRRADLCETCRGTGKCMACQGTGFVKLLGDRKAPCTACNGTGRCPACGGRGRGEIRCPRCRGSGRVPHPERAFRQYRALLQSLGKTE